MKGITTGQNLKLMIIVCCCLCVTVTNCDKKLFSKRSVIGTNLEAPIKIEEPVESAQILATPAPQNSNSNHLNVPKTDAEVKTVSENSKADTRPESKPLTSKTSNLKSNSTKVNPGQNITSTSTTVRKSNIQPPINTGALFRGAFVFLGLSIVVIAYIIFRCTRLNRNRTQMVRKYGILAHRQDVEMRPLPLDDEDEDDTTVFDASEVAAIHDKQRRTT